MEDNKLDLTALRSQIDGIDQQIAALYEERMEVCDKVADYKIQTGKTVFDRVREEEKIRSVQSMMHTPLNSQGIGELFSLIMSISRKLQYKKLAKNGAFPRSAFIPVDSLTEKGKPTVVFQGAPGSYSQAAMERFFSSGCISLSVDTFRDAMCAIDEGSADFAVLPIENSTAGIVSEIYDLLAEFENYIVGEQLLPIRHCLLGLPGSDISRIKKVYAHPQALMQSARFLSSHPWEQIGMKNNAFAAARVKEEADPTQAAVAGAFAAQYYGLSVLEEDIQQSDSNSTRFIIVTNQKIYPKDAKKISICFEVPHKSGSLYHMLSHFIYNDLNMTKIESRPLTGRDWEYRFFLDFEGNLSDGAVKNALRGLREEAINLRILGNY